MLRSPGDYVWCQQCGAYNSSANPRSTTNLLKRGCQVPTQQGRANLKRIRDGRPPCNLAVKLARRLGTLSRETLSLPPLHKRQGSIDPATPEDHTLSLQDPAPTTLSMPCHGDHAMSMAGA